MIQSVTGCKEPIFHFRVANEPKDSECYGIFPLIGVPPVNMVIFAGCNVWQWMFMLYCSDATMMEHDPSMDTDFAGLTWLLSNEDFQPYFDGIREHPPKIMFAETEKWCCFHDLEPSKILCPLYYGPYP